MSCFAVGRVPPTPSSVWASRCVTHSVSQPASQPAVRARGASSLSAPSGQFASPALPAALCGRLARSMPCGRAGWHPIAMCPSVDNRAAMRAAGGASRAARVRRGARSSAVGRMAGRTSSQVDPSACGRCPSLQTPTVRVRASRASYCQCLLWPPGRPSGQRQSRMRVARVFCTNFEEDSRLDDCR